MKTVFVLLALIMISGSISQSVKAASPVSNGCRVDAQCGQDQICVKTNHPYIGECVQKIGGSGNSPDVKAPKLDRNQKKENMQCDTSKSCPMLFRCDYQFNVCIR